jgi:hypothetical protein
MALEAERAAVRSRDALQAAVEQRYMRDANVRRECGLDREAVVLARVSTWPVSCPAGWFAP